MRISILGKQWNLKFVPHLGKNKDGVPYLGHCDDPNNTDRIIKIVAKLDPKQELEIILHELNHAFVWNHDESFVNQIGKDLSEVLWKLGYRRLTKEQRKQLDIE